MTNNQRKKCTILLIFSLALIISLSGCSALSAKKVSKSTFVLNTVATITLFDGSDEAIIDSCFDLCREYEALLSRTVEDSDISKLNRRETETVSDATAKLIAAGLHYSALTGGAFDISVEPISSLWDFGSETHSVPDAAVLAAAAKQVDYRSVLQVGNKITFSSPDTRLDLGAIAKGYIADKMKEFLISQGVKSAIINLGGNVLCIGGKTAKAGFDVAILRPFESSAIATLTVSDCSVVTSGVYERCFEENGVLYHHLLDTETGLPIDNGLLSVTIISKNSVDGDALSTACFALGPEEGMELIKTLPDTYAVFITSDYELHLSPGLEASYKITY